MALRHLMLSVGLLVLAGCEVLPLNAEIDRACAGAPDPKSCAKAKYTEAFADERARFAREGFVR